MKIIFEAELRSRVECSQFKPLLESRLSMCSAKVVDVKDVKTKSYCIILRTLIFLKHFCMNNVKSSVSNVGDGSSDGEEDFESADEGESKEKVSSSSDKDVSRSGSVPTNVDELSGDSMTITGNLKPESEISVCDETSSLESAESISEPSPVSGDKDDNSKVHCTGEESDVTINTPINLLGDSVGNSENRKNEE